MQGKVTARYDGDTWQRFKRMAVAVRIIEKEGKSKEHVDGEADNLSLETKLSGISFSSFSSLPAFPYTFYIIILNFIYIYI